MNRAIGLIALNCVVMATYLDRSANAADTPLGKPARTVLGALGETRADLIPAVLTADRMRELSASTGLRQTELLEPLVELAKQRATPTISGFYVGAVGVTDTRSVLLGWNMEFPGMDTNVTVHGEHVLVALAHQRAQRLTGLRVNAEPCGNCRQLLVEHAGPDLQVSVLGQRAKRLKQLLPNYFYPEIKVKTAKGLRLAAAASRADQALADAALQVAKTAYTPYTGSHAGVAIKMGSGTIFTGHNIENVAFNHALSPWQTALIELRAAGESFKNIDRAVLVEKPNAKVSHALLFKEAMRRVAPHALRRTRIYPLK